MKKQFTKQFKGRMIRMRFMLNGYENSRTGIITAQTTKQILFRINKSEVEIPIIFENIIEIIELK